MTPKQAKYVENRIAGMAPRQAAIAAGYAHTGADSAASANEKRADVQKAIKKKAKPAVTVGRSAGGRRSKADKLAETLAGVDPEAKSYLREHYDNPLDLLLHVMNETKAPDGLRVQCAKDAAPYVHGKVAPAAGKGKKEQQEERAKEQSRNGKFARRSAPRATGITVN